MTPEGQDLAALLEKLNTRINSADAREYIRDCVRIVPDYAAQAGPADITLGDLRRLLALLLVEANQAPPFEAIRNAAKLVESEARKWEGADGRTAEHWRNTATALQGYLLAVDVLSDCAAPLETRGVPQEEHQKNDQARGRTPADS